MAAALALGIAGLSMRQVAARLGVSTPALYRYFSNLEALLDAVVDELDRRIPLPPDRGEPWTVWGYEFAYAVRRLLEAAPGLADRALIRTQPTMGVLGRYELSIGIAVRSGFDQVTALWATRAVTEYVQAWVARSQRQEAAARLDRKRGGWVQDAVEDWGPSDLPQFSEALRQSARFDEDLRFDYGLRCLLAGIEACRKARLPLKAPRPRRRKPLAHRVRS